VIYILKCIIFISFDRKTLPCIDRSEKEETRQDEMRWEEKKREIIGEIEGKMGSG